jgi:hypothetical protein
MLRRLGIGPGDWPRTSATVNKAVADPRLVLLAMIVASLIGGVVIGLLLRGGSSGAGGSPLDLGGLRDWLEGKKTYIGMVTLAINNYAARRGWIDTQLATDLNTALGLLTGAAFVAKVNRVEQKTEQAVTAAKIAAVMRPKEGV